MNIFDYWWIWDFIAQEWVEDLGSILIGLLAGTVLYAPTSLVPILLMAFRKRSWLAWACVTWLCLTVAILVALKAHGLWNAYQIWYSTPLGESVGWKIHF